VVGGAAQQLDLLAVARPLVADSLAGTLTQNGQGWVPNPDEVRNSEMVLVLASPW
jgi:hypothetical protein